MFASQVIAYMTEPC